MTTKSKKETMMAASIPKQATPKRLRQRILTSELKKALVAEVDEIDETAEVLMHTKLKDPLSPDSLFDPSFDDYKHKRYLERKETEAIAAQKEGRNPRLIYCRFEELPVFLQDNDFIVTGYRAFYTYAETWRSMFALHNETGNIWTHGIGAIVFILLSLFAHWLIPKEASWLDYIIVCAYFMSAASCLLFSTIFHTHYVHSKRAFVQFGCLDYAGISILICGSCCLVTYFTYHCHPFTRNFWVIMTVIMASVGIIGPLHEYWSHRNFRKWRVFIYLMSGIVSAYPIIQYLLFHGLPKGLDPSVSSHIISMLALYIGGACIYATRMPECFWPGKFDLLFHSHQFWHVCVFAACCLHYQSAMKLLEWRLGHGTCTIDY